LNTEHSRKHGPFDRRYPPILHKPRRASLWRLGEEATDWDGFLARFFAGCRRHDFDALAAYESYRHDADAVAHIAQEDPPTGAETERWEGEGGAATGRLRRPRRG
jgi:hypothetical protein